MSEEVKWHDWKIVKKLGEGGFGTVYEIMRNRYSIEEHRALKVISIPSDESDVKRVMAEGMSEANTKEYYRSLVNEFIKEIAFLSELRGCAHIVTYDDYRVVEKKSGYGWDIYIMMELLTPLPDLMEKEPLSEQQVIKLGEDISDALSVCHGKNILHRDIKADNIFVARDGTFKLGDFGIARTVEKTTGAHTRIGTNTYMAPEAYRGLDYDSRADLYSLGILLYRMLNDNRIPFLPPYPTPITVQDRDDALTRRLEGEPLPLPARGSAALTEVVLKACAYRPEDRYATAAEMKEALSQAAHARVASPRPRREYETLYAEDDYEPSYTAPAPPAHNDYADGYSEFYPPQPDYYEAPGYYEEPAPPAPAYIPQRDYYEDPEPPARSSGINAGLAIVIVLIVLVLIGGGVTIFALLNRDAVDSIQAGSDTRHTEAVTEAVTAAPATLSPDAKTVTIALALPDDMSSSMELKAYFNGEAEPSVTKTVTEKMEEYFIDVPITGDETVRITLDDADYFSCTLDYASGATKNETYY